jgi:hypothetical protein
MLILSAIGHPTIVTLSVTLLMVLNDREERQGKPDSEFPGDFRIRDLDAAVPDPENAIVVERRWVPGG